MRSGGIEMVCYVMSFPLRRFITYYNTHGCRSQISFKINDTFINNPLTYI